MSENATADPLVKFQIEEVVARDGLQNLPPWPAEKIVQLIELIYAAGIRQIEIGSLVNPKIVPAMAHTVEVLRTVQAKHLPGLCWSVLVPRFASFEVAADAGVPRVAVAVARDETFQEKNWHNTIQDNLKEMAQIFALRAQKYPALQIKAYLMMAWMPDRPLAQDRDLLVFLHEHADEVCLADTAAQATEKNLLANLEAAAEVISPAQLSLHLHGLSNPVLQLSKMAAQWGIRKFDAALGGLGGCPFLNSSYANVNTRLLYLLLRDLNQNQAPAILEKPLQIAESFLQKMMQES